jgi:WhiB family redox-sensing transcriptional regulator
MSADWFSDAACRGMSADLFFPERGEDVTLPKSICAKCPVLAPCLDFAVVNSENFGIWGGLAERGRRRVRRDRGIRRRPGGPRVTTHGTTAAYRRHLREGTPTCASCRADNAEKSARGKARMRQRSEAS